MKEVLFIPLIIVSVVFLNTTYSVLAQSIEVEDIEVFYDTSTGITITPTNTPKPTKPPKVKATPTPELILEKEKIDEFQKKGYYVIKEKYDKNVKIENWYKFSVSKTQANLGSVKPNQSHSEKIKIQLITDTTTPYQVDIINTTPLKNRHKEYIINTQCDDSRDSCTEKIAKKWKMNSSYGWGYNLTGDNINQTFINKNYFRPFPNLNQNEEYETIIYKSGNDSITNSTMTIKINYPKKQTETTYNTNLKLIAIPSLK